MNKLQGYSHGVVTAVAALDPASVWGSFMQTCVKQGVPIAQIARDLRVSRPTVYSWLTGQFQPNGVHVDMMRAWLSANLRNTA